MNDTIYAVVCGYYSDKHTMGYCTTRNLAERYCALQNKGSMVLGDYRVEEIPCLDDEGAKVEKIWYVYCFAFKHVQNGWKVTPVGCSFDEKHTTDHQHHEPEVTDRRFDERAYPSEQNITVKAWVDQADRDRAKKIAIDAFYMWIANNPPRDTVIE